MKYLAILLFLIFVSKGFSSGIEIENEYIMDFEHSFTPYQLYSYNDDYYVLLRTNKENGLLSSSILKYGKEFALDWKHDIDIKGALFPNRLYFDDNNINFISKYNPWAVAGQFQLVVGTLMNYKIDINNSFVSMDMDTSSEGIYSTGLISRDYSNNSFFLLKDSKDTPVHINKYTNEFKVEEIFDVGFENVIPGTTSFFQLDNGNFIKLTNIENEPFTPYYYSVTLEISNTEGELIKNREFSIDGKLLWFDNLISTKNNEYYLIGKSIKFDEEYLILEKKLHIYRLNKDFDIIQEVEYDLAKRSPISLFNKCKYFAEDSKLIIYGATAMNEWQDIKNEAEYTNFGMLVFDENLQLLNTIIWRHENNDCQLQDLINEGNDLYTALGEIRVEGDGTEENPGFNRMYVAKLKLTPTSVEELEDENEISIYPNPVNDLLNINAKESFIGANYQIHDITGNKVLEGTLLNNWLSLESLPVGTYILQIRHLNNIKTIKFQKQ